MKVDPSCIFCKIVAKEASSSIIYEDADVMAFLDIRPLTEGHVLVIPREHYVDVFDISDELLCKVHLAVKHVAAAVKETTKAGGISVIQQTGKAAGQDIFHFHVHIVPRHEGEKLPSFSELKMVERERLDKTASEMRRLLN